MHRLIERTNKKSNPFETFKNSTPVIRTQTHERYSDLKEIAYLKKITKSVVMSNYTQWRSTRRPRGQYDKRTGNKLARTKY